MLAFWESLGMIASAAKDDASGIVPESFTCDNSIGRRAIHVWPDKLSIRRLKRFSPHLRIGDSNMRVRSTLLFIMALVSLMVGSTSPARADWEDDWTLAKINFYLNASLHAGLFTTYNNLTWYRQGSGESKTFPSQIFTEDNLGMNCVADNHRRFLIDAVEKSLTSQNSKPLKTVGDTQSYSCTIGYLPIWHLDLLTGFGHINLRTDVTVKVISQVLTKDRKTGKITGAITVVQFTSWRTRLDDDYDFNDNNWPAVWALPLITGAELTRIQNHGYARTFNCTSDVVNFTNNARVAGNYTTSTIPK